MFAEGNIGLGKCPPLLYKAQCNFKNYHFMIFLWYFSVSDRLYQLSLKKLLLNKKTKVIYKLEQTLNLDPQSNLATQLG